MRYNDAFSLIELIVAVGLFATVSTIATSALLILTKAEQKAVNVQTSHDNLRYALETMAKEIRTSGNYELCDPPLGPSNPSSCFIFLIKPNTPNPTAVIYKSSADANECGGVTGGPLQCITKAVKTCNAGETAAQCKTRARTVSPEFHPVTAPEIAVNTLDFYLSGVDVDDPLRQFQPRVTIVIRAQTPGGLNPLSSSLNVQTTISQFPPELYIIP